MADFQTIYNKLPDSLKDKFLIRKRERAIEIVQEKIKLEGKSYKDFDYNTMEGLIKSEEQKLSNEQLKTLLISFISMEGLNYLADL
jgi:hypothetical protein